MLTSVAMVDNQFIATWMSDVHDKVTLHGLNGARIKEIALPAIGSVSGFTGRRSDTETFYSFTSFTYPTTIYRYDFATGASTVFKRPEVAFDPARYETVQVFYPSKDGTKIPMFLTWRKGLAKDGRNPTYLYGYGGFNIATTPSFSAVMIPWLEMGGIYAVANLRGGNEYGQAWYEAGRLKNKQNVFDDFIAAAEYLIRERYTSTPKLAIAGGSNGGLLVGACLVQRPDLFGAALPAVGVMDMLRYQKFTIGWAWKSDYGDPDTQEGFDINIKYLAPPQHQAGRPLPSDLRDDGRPRRPRGAGAQLQVHRDAAGGPGRTGADPHPHRDPGRTRGRQAGRQDARGACRHVLVPGQGTQDLTPGGVRPVHVGRQSARSAAMARRAERAAPGFRPAHESMCR